jgi:hypothetical protein
MRHYVVCKFLFMNFTNNYVLKLLTHVKNNKNMSIYCKTLGHTWLIYVTNDPLQYRTFYVETYQQCLSLGQAG